MRFVFFDQSTGVSGDKINASLFGLHTDRVFLERTLFSLGLTDVSVRIFDERVSGLSAWRFEVVSNSHVHAHNAHRGLGDIEKIIDGSKLSPRVRDLSKKIFRVLAESEAAVHGTSVDTVDFHEVGAVDAICDIVCASAQIEKLAPERIFATPFYLESGGQVSTAHGLLPVPVPAVLEIVKGLPVRVKDVHDEITTPTGAAIIKSIVNEYAIPDSFIPEMISYGAGTKKFDFPNLLRTVRGQTIEKKGVDGNQRMLQIETQVDDMNPQIIPEVLEGLFELGAADAFCVNVMMKKGRPGFLFMVLADEKHFDACMDYLLSATPTIGVRYFQVDRRILGRECVSRNTSAGDIRFKRVRLPDGSFREVPEFEDVKAAAARNGITVFQAFQKIQG